MKCYSRLSLIVAFVAAFALANSAYAKEPTASKELLYGTWSGTLELDVAAVQELLKNDPIFKDTPADQAELYLSVLKQQFEKTKLEATYNKDGSAKATIDGINIPAAEKNMEGTWEVVKTDGAAITIMITAGGNGEKPKTKELSMRFIDEKTMTMELSAGKKLPKGVAFKLTKK